MCLKTLSSFADCSHYQVVYACCDLCPCTFSNCNQCLEMGIEPLVYNCPHYAEQRVEGIRVPICEICEQSSHAAYALLQLWFQRSRGHANWGKRASIIIALVENPTSNCVDTLSRGFKQCWSECNRSEGVRCGIGEFNEDLVIQAIFVPLTKFGATWKCEI